jgi:hypothetical protein
MSSHFLAMPSCRLPEFTHLSRHSFLRQPEWSARIFSEVAAVQLGKNEKLSQGSVAKRAVWEIIRTSAADSALRW